MMNDLYSWCAGFICADGHIGFMRWAKNDIIYPRIMAYNTELAHIKKIQEVVGGTISNVKAVDSTRRPGFRLDIGGARAVAFALNMFPYLTGRHKWLAALLILFPLNKRGKRYTEEDKLQRKEILLWSRQANQIRL